VIKLGKCKQRLLAKAKNNKTPLNYTRQNALADVVEELTHNPSSPSAKSTITLFGFSAEELSEAGLTYEVLRWLDCIIRNFWS